MSRQYKPVSDRAKAEHGDDVVDLDLSAADELDAVTGGHLEIVPCKYTVLVDNFAEGDKGSEYEAAMYLDIETALVGGGVLKRVEQKPPAEEKTSDKPAKKTSAKKKADN